MADDVLSRMFGLRIVFTASAMRDTDSRTFPVSKNRSKRIHKKLVNRFGGEFHKVPVIVRTPHGIFVHPSFQSKLTESLTLFLNH